MDRRRRAAGNTSRRDAQSRPRSTGLVQPLRARARDRRGRCRRPCKITRTLQVLSRSWLRTGDTQTVKSTLRIVAVATPLALVSGCSLFRLAPDADVVARVHQQVTIGSRTEESLVVKRGGWPGK